MILIDPQLNGDQASEKLPSARTLARFLSEAQIAARLKGEVNVLLTTDSNQRALNRQFRNKNKTTDVLSFPALQTHAKEKIAGDLSISLPVARRQAAEQGHSVVIELKVLVLHGLLHLSGHDHETDAGEMARKEKKLREKLGLPAGLIERVEGKAPRKNAAKEKISSKKSEGKRV